MAYTMEDLLSVLHPHGPAKVDALSKNRRRVEHGLTTVGLRSSWSAERPSHCSCSRVSEVVPRDREYRFC